MGACPMQEDLDSMEAETASWHRESASHTESLAEELRSEGLEFVFWAFCVGRLIVFDFWAFGVGRLIVLNFGRLVLVD